MRIEIKRQGMQIIPENEQDIAYIEDSLNLRHEGEFIYLERVARTRASYPSVYLQTTKGVPASD